jgi:hypothetical protein
VLHGRGGWSTGGEVHGFVQHFTGYMTNAGY